MIFGLAAPSGAGKTTLGNGLLAIRPRLRRVVTCTTRSPRAGEKDGLDYHFLTGDSFASRVAAGDFLEHATVYGRSYGTLMESVRLVLDEGADALLTIDVQGIASVRRAAQESRWLSDGLFTVFLTPSSGQELAARLVGRGSEAPSAAGARLASAAGEVAQWRNFDYLIVSGSPEYDLARAAAIYDAERLRSRRCDFHFH